MSRNCQNEKQLSDNARFFERYTDEIKDELSEKEAEKSFVQGTLKFYECPLTYISEDTQDMMKLIGLIENTNVLLHEGGWGNQPYWLIEAYHIYKETREKIKNAN